MAVVEFAERESRLHQDNSVARWDAPSRSYRCSMS